MVSALSSTDEAQACLDLFARRRRVEPPTALSCASPPLSPRPKFTLDGNRRRGGGGQARLDRRARQLLRCLGE